MCKKLLWSIAFACSFIFGQTAFAHSWGCGEGLKQMVESLKLDDAQKGKIQPILNQLKTTIKEDAAPMSDLDDQINKQVNSTTMDQNTVNGLIDNKTKLIGDMIKAKLTAKNQIFVILTPEQRTSLQKMMKDVDEKMAAKFKSCHQDD